MRCKIIDTGEQLNCQECGRQWPKLPPTGAPEDCYPMLAARLENYRTALLKISIAETIERAQRVAIAAVNGIERRA